MPPVSITSVWPPAMIASGAANRIVFEAQSGVTVPGRTSSTPMTKTASNRISA